MDTKVLLAATMLSVLFFGAMGAASIAYAQYLGDACSSGEPGAHVPKDKCSIQLGPPPERADRHTDRGLSYLDADGAMGASVAMGAVFGGTAGAFFLRGRSGKYAAVGRG